MGATDTAPALVTAATRRLLLARAAALGIEHALAYPHAGPQETELGAPDGSTVLTILWPEHDPMCECEDCEEVIEAYEVAWLEELDAQIEEEENA